MAFDTISSIYKAMSLIKVSEFIYQFKNCAIRLPFKVQFEEILKSIMLYINLCKILKLAEGWNNSFIKAVIAVTQLFFREKTKQKRKQYFSDDFITLSA